jgi:hypothetical protein
MGRCLLLGLRALATVAFVLGLSSAAQAGSVTFQIGVAGSPVSYDIEDFAFASSVTLPDGSIQYQNGSYSTSSWSLTLTSLTVNPDPIVSFVGGVTNNNVAAQDFILSIQQVVPAIPGGTLIGGSTILTYADSNFDGAGALKNALSGGAGYSGTIDGDSFPVPNPLELLLAFNLTPLFPGDATQFVSQTAGLPGPTLPGPAVASTIGITHRFNLSPSDSATFNSTFIVVVPEPATGLLAGLGVLLLAALRRAR